MTRTLFTVFVLLLDEAILAALVIFVLWKLGVELSLGVIIGLVVLLGVCVFALYRLIAPVLNRKPVTGREGMIGLEGKVVKPLTPEGVVKVCGELWKASSTDASISTDEEVVVMGLEEGLRLFVRRKKGAEQGEDVGQKDAKLFTGTRGINHNF